MVQKKYWRAPQHLEPSCERAAHLPCTHQQDANRPSDASHGIDLSDLLQLTHRPDARRGAGLLLGLPTSRPADGRAALDVAGLSQDEQRLVVQSPIDQL